MLQGVYVAGDGELIDPTVCEFYFDEFFKVPKGPFCGKGRGDGCGLIGLNWSFGKIGDGTTAARFNAFDFDGLRSEVTQCKFCFCGFWGCNVAKVVGGFKPLYLW